VSDKDELTGIPFPKVNRTMKMTDGYNDRPRALTREERLRKENPGLQELWEQYQTMLKLLTPAEPDKPPMPLGPIKRKKMRR